MPEVAEGDCEMSNEIQISAKNVVRVYEGEDGEGVRALDDLTMDVKKGEIVSLIGPSGCGKSTFLRLVAGLDKPQGGVILNDGEEIASVNKNCGFVFQEANLFPWLSVYKNIAFGLKMNKKLKEDRDMVSKYMSLMGLEGFEKAFPYQISGGMASRASLARTFIQDPGIILLDEPLSALDAFTRENLQEAILKIWNENKPSIILVTHDIEEAVFLSHRVVIMSERPSKVIGEVEINLDHPRDRMSGQFIKYRRQIKKSLENTKRKED